VAPNVVIIQAGAQPVAAGPVWSRSVLHDPVGAVIRANPAAVAHTGPTAQGAAAFVHSSNWLDIEPTDQTLRYTQRLEKSAGPRSRALLILSRQRCSRRLGTAGSRLRALNLPGRAQGYGLRRIGPLPLIYGQKRQHDEVSACPQRKCAELECLEPDQAPLFTAHTNSELIPGPLPAWPLACFKLIGVWH